MTNKTPNLTSPAEPTAQSAISQTRALVNDADAVLMRLMRNREAMAKPAQAPPPRTYAPYVPAATSDVGQRYVPSVGRPKGNALSESQYAALTAILNARGTIANSDLQRVLGISMLAASQQLSRLRFSEHLVRLGIGSKTRYLPGPQWPLPVVPLAPVTPPDPAAHLPPKAEAPETVAYVWSRRGSPPAHLPDLGERLLQQSLQWLWDQGAQSLTVSTAAHNTAAQGLFERLGFRRVVA